MEQATALADSRSALVEVYRYLHHRCGSKSLAEDLSSEAVLAAVDRLLAGEIERITVAYVVGIARHKLVDHWRRAERDRRHLELHHGHEETRTDVVFESDRSAATLARLSPMHRAALTLRYIDDLRVPDVASLLGRSVASTETLLMRAKRAFRDEYERMEDDDE
ncbi:MAG: sigma-70 family RNA polymerase sigma factor [Actinomycetia bacterium]|nr:sigma-70 family RNA polymerase sigma factor [Actinomycetes bacterium]